jgi:hypothetical protein
LRFGEKAPTLKVQKLYRSATVVATEAAGVAAHGEVVEALQRPSEFKAMGVKLNNTGYAHAKEEVQDGRFVLDKRDDWSEHQPSAAEENRFIEERGWSEYGRWHLGVDDDHRKDTKAHYKFPYGDFREVHRCAVLSAESRAGQRKYFDVETAAAHLHGMLEGIAAR